MGTVNVLKVIFDTEDWWIVNGNIAFNNNEFSNRPSLSIERFFQEIIIQVVQ